MMKKVWCVVFATAFLVVSCMEYDMYHIPDKTQIVQDLGIPVPGQTATGKFIWLKDNAQSGMSYLVELNADENMIAATVLEYEVSNVTVHLKGSGGQRVIKFAGPSDGSSNAPSGSLFTVQDGVTLVLDENITLKGLENNNAPLVNVEAGGKLIMNAGSKITGNKGTSYYVTGVLVKVGAEFIMDGGEISDNSNSSQGGGVNSSGTFTMNKGTITRNASIEGGGVIVFSGDFTMNGGTISGNTAYSGGGVNVNQAYGTTFTMNGGTISGNTATYGGGGVLVQLNGSFTMEGGTISNNTAASNGGGVSVTGTGTFIKTGGTIYGNDAGTNSNMASTTATTSGHAVYGGPNRYRNTTAGPGVVMDSNTAAPKGWDP